MTEQSYTIDVPELGLIVLVGASGSGKSTFAHRHFASTEVVSSDQCRALVGDDETDQSVTAPAFALLHDIIDKRLEVGRLTVVDATNAKREDRKSLLELARKWDVLATAIVFDLPIDVCFERNGQRSDRTTPDHAIRRQHKAVRRSVKGLRKERFTRVHVIDSVDKLDSVHVEQSRLWTDRRDDSGPFDIIGDVHGCADELIALLDKLGYETDAAPIAHPEGRRALFLGDLVDRGPGSDRVLELAMAMVDAGTALCILGNHENKLGRALAGRNVTVSHGLAETLEQLDARPPEFREQVAAFIDGLVSHYILDEGRLVVAHAGLPERYQGRSSGRVRSIALYGDTDGETDEFGLPIRYPWAEDYRGPATVVYGHTPVPDAEWLNNTICLDTGAVFGGRLTALRWPEKELVEVNAEREYYEPIRPLAAEPVERPPLLLDVKDVLGKHFVETSLAGRITIDAERSSAAIEVMSRFATDPRWLVHLPPTMAPVATSKRPDFLEHPDDAFDYYRKAGVGEVVCQEKHMGSRAVLIFARTEQAALERFGITNDAAGVIVTRTGRPFFADIAKTKSLLDRVRASIDEVGLWEELGTDWLVLDAELLPWSAKAIDLLKSQYAATGTAATTMLSAASTLVDQATARGVDGVEELARRTASRLTHTERYVDAYRQYCWDTDGLDGIEIAPFQILASEGDVHARKPHRWHLDHIDRLVEHNPDLFRRTERRFIDLANEAAVAEATSWWLDATGAGGEGMVVKPTESITSNKKGLVLPGVKCRGREYLRIIYGPEYLEPANLERLRERSLGRKRSLAIREFALGIEALDRFVAREHLFRTHQCVFGVLALESEPVDPRL
ncbi:MAG: polynucleotide kinase-phosphatase [Actinomycetota bacterium]